MRKTSYLALVAAAGLFGATVAPAVAADLGGGCCADLEERVAELEATTARKGNRVVSLQVYGQVNKALLFFDNDDVSDVFVVDNDASSSRFGFKGSAKIKPGWTAGYTMEVDLYGDSNSSEVTVADDEGVLSSSGPSGTTNPELRIRVNEVYIESEQFGRITLGQGQAASDGTSEIVLANSLSNSDIAAGDKIVTGVGVSDGALRRFVNNLDGASRTDRIRYDSPSIYGFVVSASWGENDYYDVALRFKKEFNSIRIAAGVSYLVADELIGSNFSSATQSNLGDFEQVSGSISVMHVPTGIYGAFAAGQRQSGDAINASGTTVVENDTDPSFWYAQVGVEKRFFSYGTTTVYAEYGEYDDVTATSAGNSLDTHATRIGLGVVQTIDSAAMDLYAQANFWDVDANVEGKDEGEVSTVMVGSRIKF